MFKKIETPELLLALYFWGFVFLKPFLNENPAYSTFVLIGYVFVLFTFFFINIQISSRIINKKFGCFAVVILVFLLIDSCLRWNDMSFSYLYQYIYSGLIPIFLLSAISDFEKLLKYFSLLSAFVFVLFGSDPLFGYPLFKDYMEYGFKLVLPAFFGVFIGFHYLKIKWMFFVEILIFVSIVIFANRSSLMAVLLFMCLYFLLTSTNKKKLILNKFLPLFFIGLFVYVNIIPILIFMVDLLDKYDYNSYALSKYTDVLVFGDDQSVLSGREKIWEQAIMVINENPFIGKGLGCFQSKYIYYSHNILLDVLMFFGIFGLLFFVVLFIRSLNCLYKAEGSFKIAGLLFLCLWFPKLLLSSTFIEEISFWCFLVLPLFYSENFKPKIYINKKFNEKV
jgi:O-antigen ligase